MKLTNAMRKDFIESVMSGIPIEHVYIKTDVQQQVANLYESQLPQEILSFAKKYPNLIKREHRISLKSLSYINTDGYERTPSIWVVDYDKYVEVDLSKFVELKTNADTETERRNALEVRLSEITNACTTLAKLKVALPELETYMPSEEVKRNLPIASGTIITDLLQLGLKVPK